MYHCTIKEFKILTLYSAIFEQIKLLQLDGQEAEFMFESVEY